MAPLSLLLLSAAPALAGQTLEVPKAEPTVLVQPWLTVYDQDEDPTADPATWGDPEDDTGLKLRRARVGLQGKNDTLSYAVVVGQSSGYDALSAPSATIGLVDAYVGVQPVKGLWITTGLQKLPISREQLMSSTQLVLAERSVGTSAFIPDAGRDAGITLDGTLGGDTARGRLRLGAYNGNGSELGDTDPGKLFAARLEGVMGPAKAYRTWGKVDGFTLGVAADGWLDQDRATTTLGYGADLIMRVDGVAVLGEIRFATISPTNTDVDVPGVLADTPRMGLMGQVGYSVGAFEPAIRYSIFDDNGNIEDNGDVAEATAGLSWHGLDDKLRLGGGYVMRMETAGRAIDNDTARLWMQLSI